jgi:CRP-like cAMP-binding protein
MNDRIDKQNSIVSRIIDGSVTIDSVAEFENLLKAFPNDPGLHRIFADLLKQEKSFDTAVATYGAAAKLFIESGLTLQAIVSKILEWRIFKPSNQEGQAFYSSLRELRSKDTAVNSFFIAMPYLEMIAFMIELTLQQFPSGSMVKRFGDEENTLYFVVSGALEETSCHRLEKDGNAQKESTKNLVEDDFFGEIYPFEEEKISQSDIETITRVELAKISKAKLMAICRKYPNVKLLVNDLYETHLVSDEEEFSRTVRKTVRHQLPTQVELKIFQDEPGKAALDLAGFTENISLGGACIVLGAKYETGHVNTLTGKNVKIQITLPIASDRLSILGTIVWSKEVSLEGKTTGEVGIKFKEMADTDRRILKDCLYGSEGEQNLIWSLWDSLMEK